ncbi:MAG: hypothetical protein KJO11_11070, partial [Gemmatimonadetes bacterium]|nr:hypothetical protein [Gemmatimonadota bacterium]
MNEDEARAVWLRAAELQAEKAQRHELEARLLGPGDESEQTGDSLTVDAVRRAGVEAGIAQEYIDLALAESRLTTDSSTRLVGWKDRAATRQLGTDARRIALSRRIDAPPARVLEAMERILPHAPYQLMLEDSVGDDPLDGATLLFRVPKVTTLYTPFSYTMAQVEIRQIGFTLRPRDEKQATELSLTASLGRSRKANWIASNVLAGLGGTTGGLIGFGIAKATALAGAVIAAPIAAGTVVAGGLTVWGMRAAYRSALRKSKDHFENMLKGITMDCRMGPGFFATR